MCLQRGVACITHVWIQFSGPLHAQCAHYSLWRHHMELGELSEPQMQGNCVHCVGRHNLMTHPDVRCLIKNFQDALYIYCKLPLTSVLGSIITFLLWFIYTHILQCVGRSKMPHGSYMTYTAQLWPQVVYCWVRGVSFDRREYIADLVVYIWSFTTVAQRNGIFLFLQWNGQFSPALTIGEPLSAI